ncbi:amino acid adenylation domain-containing protein [Paenibacillus polymyxa]|uniref:amino acid adenylation domain-containing protein n=1 Tax=Paenibacillus polymyxa TaxID=1406 RepID=UPI00321644A5
MKNQKNNFPNSKSLIDKINDLSEDKKRYLTQMLLTKKNDDCNEGWITPNKKIQKRSRSISKIPCLPIQTDFWYRWNLFPEDSSDNIAGYVKLKGMLEPGVLEKAFSELVSRHEVLRSKFIYEQGKVWAQVEPAIKCDMKIVDCTDISGLNVSEAYEEMMRQEASIPFDLSRGSLIRFRCYKVAADEWYLLMVQHHIISDGTSTNILIKELLHLMARLSGSIHMDLPELNVQFYDYVMNWNAKQEQGEFDFQKEYWENELKDCDMDLRLANSPDNRPDDLFGGERVRFKVEKKLNEQIHIISRKYAVTPFSILMAAFRTVLYRYTKQEDSVILIPVQGRNQQDTEALIGCFLNMLPIRNPLRSDESFIECVQRENKKVLGALDHQDIPFGSILKEIGIRSDSLHTSVYQTVFSYEGNVMKNVLHGDFEIEFDELALGSTKSDLVLELNQVEDGLDGWFEYKISRFSRKQIELFKDAFLELLRNAVASENQSIVEINILTEEEKALILSFGTGIEEQWELKTINSIFSDIAAVQPEREALIYAGGTMSYDELDKASNKFARYLRNIGVGSETIVGLMMGKSAEFFVALLGVIKAGGAYLPIEPTYPEERIRYIMEDSGALFLVFDEEYTGNLAFLPTIYAVNYNDLQLGQLTDDRLPEYNTINSLAYVIYTSGTTGNPKGVMVEHRGVSNLTLHFQKHYDLGPEDRVLQFAHIVFDACVWEWALSLLIGGGLCIVKKEVILDVPAFVKQIREFAVTVVEFSPQYWKQISKEGLSFKLLLTAGSEADENLVRSASESEIYVNGYGPTENTIGITLWTKLKDTEIPKKIPIGKPISNVQVYILDGDKLCGVGVTGEICAAGTDVARGYLNRPELTKAKFIDNPFGAGKLYRTGDYGRWLENSDIAFSGRIDTQVKIRSYRVETGEIENCICRLEGVEAAVVQAIENADGEKTLAAYLVLENSLTIKEMDSYLKRHLPFYMIPSRYYRIDAIPLTSNGKTDFKKLQKQGVMLDLGNSYVEPSTATERELVSIWEELLNIPGIGVDDSFFELGGDSVIILQVISKAAQVGIHIELKSFYEDKTIAKIANNAVVMVDNIARWGNTAGEYSLSPAQKLFFDRKPGNPHYSNRSILLALEKNLGLYEVNEALNAILEHHDVLRTRWTQIVDLPIPSIPAYKPMQLVEQFGVNDKNPIHYEEMIQRIQSSLRLDEGKLVHAALIQTKDLDHSQLLLTVHRLVCDEGSMDIIVKDLVHALKAKRANEPMVLPSKTTSYQAWSNEVKRYAHTRISEMNRQKWLAEDYSDVGLLPRDFASGTNFEADTQRISTELCGKYAELLIHQNFGTFKITVFELILSAFASTLNKWSKCGGIIFLDNDERDLALEGIDVSRTVGCFSSPYPFHFKDSFFANGAGELMKAIKNQLFMISQRKHDFLIGMQNGDLFPDTLTNMEVILKNAMKPASDGSTGAKLIKPSNLFEHDGCNERAWLIELEIHNVGGTIVFEWTYSVKIHSMHTVQALAESLTNEIVTLLDYCLTSTDEGITASDYRNSDIDANELDYILGKFGQ